MGVLGRLAGRTLTVSVVLVHYHTPALAEASLRALREDAAHSRIDLECILVDNGSTPDERRQLASLPCTYLPAVDAKNRPANLGYAGGVNLGVAASTRDTIVIMNPDVFVVPGCLSALQDALHARADVVGPRFFLDRARRVLQPPAEPRTRWRDLRTTLAQARLGTRSARRRWRRDAHRFWRTMATSPWPQLSGALLAFRRETWERVGPFDPEYRLYFEETDWLARLRQRGGRACFVPTAEAVHLFAQSTLSEPRSAEWFEASARRYRRRWYGAPYTAWVEWLSERLSPRRARRQTRRLETDPPDPASVATARWLELSVDSTGFPAAGVALGPSDSPAVDLDPLAVITALQHQLAPTIYTLRWVDAAGRDLAARTIDLRSG